MLNSPVQVGETDESAKESVYSAGKFGSNPFPGLRPFTMEECYLFFGREGQVDDILNKLSKHKTVTVMGYSGSGKSSLMYCGLLPVLYGGFVTDTGPFWKVVTIRPGNSPLQNLVNSFVDIMLQTGQIEEDDVQIHKSIISSVLQSGPNGLVEIAKYVLKDNENLFILIDQFEELFRFRESGDETNQNESSLFVNLILSTVQQNEVPVYFSLNMRSDFIGDCAVFPGLTEMINTSNYLVPQMTREQKRMAIEGPVAVSGGRISQRLVKRLLNEIGDHQDQLPILQHVMLRTWDYWANNHEQGEPIDIRHYNAVGKISQALSLHANEAYEELNTRQKEIAEILFKTITEKNQENLGIRRPSKVSLIAELAEAQEREVIDVIDNFRRPGRSFLMPGTHVELTSDSIIELSHESLMRIWTRLATWVEEESESAQMYKRVSEAAAMYQIGRTSLWRPPDLQLALNWQKKQRPTRAWAQRYDIAFERAIVFLDTSRITYEAELKNQEMLQRRMLRRARATNIVLALFLLVAIAFFIFGLINSIRAEKAAIEALDQKKQAEAARNDALAQRDLAEREKEKVIAQQKEIQAQRDLLEQSNQRLKILIARADSLRNLAESSSRYANIQRDSAFLARERATREFIRAEEKTRESIARLMLSIAQGLEAKSVGIDDRDLAGATAMQGYLFHKQYGGKKYDPYVFNGLYTALTKLSGKNYNAAKMPGSYKNKMFALAVSQQSSSFFTTGNEGKIYRGDYLTQKVAGTVGEKDYPNRVLALSKDERYLVNASDSSFIEVFDLSTQSKKPKVIEGHKLFVNDIKFLPDNSGFISASKDKTLRLNNHVSGQSKNIVTLPYELKSIDISADGNYVAGASPAGKLVLIDLRANSFVELRDESPNRILSVAYHPIRNLIAFGVESVSEKKGIVKILEVETKRVVKELGGHKAGISDLEFSPDGQLLASAGLDRKLQMWVVDQVDDLPVVMDNNNGYVWDLAFSKESNYLLASANDGEVRIWPTDPKMLAEQICPKLSRNMTLEEWGIYVGNAVPYESTCKTLSIKSN